MDLLLKAFLIDVVQPVDTCGLECSMPEHHKVQMITYKVLAHNPDHAFRRFTQDEAGVIVYTGDIVDRIIVGMNLDQRGIYDASEA